MENSYLTVLVTEQRNFPSLTRKKNTKCCCAMIFSHMDTRKYESSRNIRRSIATHICSHVQSMLNMHKDGNRVRGEMKEDSVPCLLTTCNAHTNIFFLFRK